jgi:glucose/arabinose dehydrogenase
VLGVVVAVAIAGRGESASPQSTPTVKLVEVGRFDQPISVASPPRDARLFVVEKSGRIWIVSRGHRLPRPFLDLRSLVSSVGFEEGLLSVAFAPDYAASGRFYVDYTDLRHRTVIEEFRRSRDPSRADPSSARIVLVIPNKTNRHHGGEILFGPDRLLYIGQGDGGRFNDLTFPGQRLDTLHGKILRIDPRRRGEHRYTIPSDNPFVGRKGARAEIWESGLRNPWRFAFAPTGALVIGDVGQLRVEEIDVAPRGGLNFGWPCLEGREPFNPPAAAAPTHCRGLTAPALERYRISRAVTDAAAIAPAFTRGRPLSPVRFDRGEKACTIVSGVAVDDPQLPSLRGRLLYGDYCAPDLHSYRLSGNRVVDVQPLGLDVFGLSSFGEDGLGRVFAVSITGPVYRLAPG